MSYFTEITSGHPPPPELVPKFVLGLTSGVLSGNCLYWNDNVIVYPAMGVIVIYDMKNHTQRYIKLSGSRRVITAMDLNVTNKVLAVASIGEDENDTDPKICIYDLISTDLKFEFTEPKYQTTKNKDESTDSSGEHTEQEDEFPRTDRRRFVNVQFLLNKIYVAALSIGDDGSDSVMYFYSWRYSTVETYIIIKGIVADMALNPIDTAICCFVGNDLFQLMTRNETNWSQYGFRETNGVNFTCVCWLCGDRCLVGTADGRVILFKNGVLQNVYHINAIIEMDVTVKMQEETLSVITPPEGEPDPEMVRICFTSQFGLVLVVGDSAVYYFQTTDEGRKYVKTHVYVKNEDRYLMNTQTVVGESPIHYIESACVSPNGKILTCITKRGQLYWAPLTNQLDDDNYDDESSYISALEIKPLGEELHYGGVASLSMSLWKPILMTCGKIDYTVKVWDYSVSRLLFSKHYPQQLHSVTVHPTGLFSVVVFSDHVEFQSVQQDDLVTLHEFKMRGCDIAAFSFSGHMFALTKLSTIDIYCSIMFEKRLTCQGYRGTIETLVWTRDDMHIVAYRLSGDIVVYNTKTGHQESNIAPFRDADPTDLAVTDDVNRIYVVDNKGFLKEFYKQQVVNELNLHQGSLNALCITQSNSVLYIAAQSGVVMEVMLPISYYQTNKEFQMHSHSITKICLAVDGSVLITCSEDGSLCFWDVKGVVNKTEEHDKIKSDEVLINWSKIEKMDEDINKIQIKLNKLKTENTNDLKKLTKTKEQEIEDKKNEYSILYYNATKENKEMANMHSDIISKLEYELTLLKDKNDQSIVKLDAKYSDQLANLYNKYLKLEEKSFAMTSKLNKGLGSLQEKQNTELQEVISYCEENLKKKDEEILILKEKLIKEKHDWEMLVGETENDVDTDVLETNDRFTTKFKKMEEVYSNTMRDLTACKMKYELYTETNKNLRLDIDEHEIHMDKLSNLASNKNKKIALLMRNLKECNELIPKKDEDIFKVSQSMTILKKELNVITQQITELKQTTEPLELKIQETKNLMENNKMEYENTTKANKFLESYIIEQKQILNDLEYDLYNENQNVQERSSAIKQMINDLGIASQSYKYTKESIKAIEDFFHKYVGVKPHYKIEDEELAAREEYYRQIRYLERSIDDHKKTLKKFDDKNESHYLIMEENMKLIEENNVYRKDSKKYFTMYNNLKVSLTEEQLKNINKPML